MKKILLFLALILCVSCSSQTKPEEATPVKKEPVVFTYQITPNLEFTEGETMDFSEAIFGNYEKVEFGSVNQEVGEHLLKATLIKEGETKVVGIPYTVKERVPSSDYFLKSLEIEGFKLEPAFTPENDLYTIHVPQGTTVINIKAQVRDQYAKIIEGVGELNLPNYDYLHRVWVQSEDGQQWAYELTFVIDPVEAKPSQEPAATTGTTGASGYENETFNGLNINYPDAKAAEMRNDLLTLVNKQYRLPADYEPSNLVQIDNSYAVYGNGFLVKEAFDAYMKMRTDAASEGLNLNISNCYRSYARQKELYNHYLSQDSQASVDTYSARPGSSEHQLGMSCDFASGQANLYDFTDTPEQLWMVKNADKYGFILRYPQGKENITGYMYESWHYRYVGKVASEIKNSGLALEEYLNQ